MQFNRFYYLLISFLFVGCTAPTNALIVENPSEAYIHNFDSRRIQKELLAQEVNHKVAKEVVAVAILANVINIARNKQTNLPKLSSEKPKIKLPKLWRFTIQNTSSEKLYLDITTNFWANQFGDASVYDIELPVGQSMDVMLYKETDYNFWFGNKESMPDSARSVIPINTKGIRKMCYKNSESVALYEY